MHFSVLTNYCTQQEFKNSTKHGENLNLISSFLLPLPDYRKVIEVLHWVKIFDIES